MSKLTVTLEVDTRRAVQALRVVNFRACRVLVKALVIVHGVRRCYKSLTFVHGFDPEVAHLAIWYARHDELPKRGFWGMDTRAIQSAPLSAEDAEAFHLVYKEMRAGSGERTK